MDLAHRFRLGMRRLASGVSVVTSYKGEERHAMTASSLTSLSNDPASLLVCINRSAAIQPLMTARQPFAVNLLGSQQQYISDQCAGECAGEERFATGEWTTDPASGLPWLIDAQAIFFCEVDGDQINYGTHQIVIGRITDIIVSGAAVDPLIYVDGDYQKPDG